MVAFTVLPALCYAVRMDFFSFYLDEETPLAL